MLANISIRHRIVSIACWAMAKVPKDPFGKQLVRNMFRLVLMYVHFL